VANSARDSQRPGVDTGKESIPPFRTPPCRDYVFFSESARSIAVCIELNSLEGLFSAPSAPREGSLVVIEAMCQDGSPCDVRLIGRVSERITKPAPLVRVKWLRAVCPGGPARLVELLDSHYGYVLPLDLARVGSDEFKYGVEYDFAQRHLHARSPDSARGDTSRFAVRHAQPEPSRRSDASAEQVDRTLGADVTQTIRMVPGHPTPTPVIDLTPRRADK